MPLVHARFVVMSLQVPPQRKFTFKYIGPFHIKRIIMAGASTHLLEFKNQVQVKDGLNVVPSPQLRDVSFTLEASVSLAVGSALNEVPLDPGTVVCEFVDKQGQIIGVGTYTPVADATGLNTTATVQLKNAPLTIGSHEISASIRSSQAAVAAGVAFPTARSPSIPFVICPSAAELDRTRSAQAVEVYNRKVFGSEREVENKRISEEHVAISGATVAAVPGALTAEEDNLLKDRSEELYPLTKSSLLRARGRFARDARELRMFRTWLRISAILFLALSLVLLLLAVINLYVLPLKWMYDPTDTAHPDDPRELVEYVVAVLAIAAVLGFVEIWLLFRLWTNCCAATNEGDNWIWFEDSDNEQARYETLLTSTTPGKSSDEMAIKGQNARRDMWSTSQFWLVWIALAALALLIAGGIFQSRSTDARLHGAAANLWSGASDSDHANFQGLFNCCGFIDADEIASQNCSSASYPNLINITQSCAPVVQHELRKQLRSVSIPAIVFSCFILVAVGALFLGGQSLVATRASSSADDLDDEVDGVLAGESNDFAPGDAFVTYSYPGPASNSCFWQYRSYRIKVDGVIEGDWRTAKLRQSQALHLVSRLRRHLNNRANSIKASDRAINMSSRIAACIVALLIAVQVLVSAIYTDNTTRTAAFAYTYATLAILAGFIEQLCSTFKKNDANEAQFLTDQINHIEQQLSNLQKALIPPLAAFPSDSSIQVPDNAAILKSIADNIAKLNNK